MFVKLALNFYLADELLYFFKIQYLLLALGYINYSSKEQYIWLIQFCNI